MEVTFRNNVRRTGLGKKIFIFFVVFLLLIAAGFTMAYFQFNNLMEPAADRGEAVDKVITVPHGASLEKISEILYTEGLIKSKLAFRIYAMYRHLDSRLQAGEYNLSAGLSTPEIITKLTKGKSASFSFTIPEGYTVRQIADKLAEKKLVDRDRFLELAAHGKFNYDFLQGLPEGPNRLEGYLFPNTYQVTRKTGEEEIINMMLRQFAKEMQASNFASLAANHGLTLHEAVTLASIVEREAQKDEERPKVAAVFLNRLKKGWKLESCATIQYILGEPKARLLEKDLLIESPYNTYKYVGLPPGPIASPGRPSMDAAVTPADVDYLFFVVSDDGRHIFSRSLQEHNKNKAIYLKRLKSGQ